MTRVTFPRSEDIWLLLPCGHYVREDASSRKCHCETPVKPDTNLAKRLRLKKARLEAREKKEVEAALNAPKPKGFTWRGTFRKTL